MIMMDKGKSDMNPLKSNYTTQNKHLNFRSLIINKQDQILNEMILQFQKTKRDFTIL